MPSLDKLHDIGKVIESHVNKANKTFQKMLNLNPNSVIILHRYATFLSEVRRCGVRVVCVALPLSRFRSFSPCKVANNPARAMKLNSQADDIEEALSKEHADLGATLTMFAVVSAGLVPMCRWCFGCCFNGSVFIVRRAAHLMLHERMCVSCSAD